MNDVITPLDEGQLDAYHYVQELLRRAAFGRLDAVPHTARTLDAFKRALASGASEIDPAPWRRFIEELCAVIAVLEAGPLAKYQGARLKVLKAICAENRDLLVPAAREAAQITIA